MRVAGSQPEAAEALGKGDDVGVDERRGDRALRPEALLLDAAHVAVGVVVEDDRDRRDVVLHGGGEFGGGEQEAAVAGDRHDGAVGRTGLGADADGQPGAERAGEARREEGPRMAELVGEVGDERQLRRRPRR